MSRESVLQRALIASILFFFALGVRAEDPRFSRINGRYLSLKNTDTRIERQAEWLEVAAAFGVYGKRREQAEDSSRALLHGALAYRTVFQKTQDPALRTSAEELLRTLASRDDSLADDALFELATNARAIDRDDVAALRFEGEILQRFPKSDSALKIMASRRAVGQSHGRAPAPEQGQVIVIDPGHGGEDFGAVGVGGLLEKDLTLAIALEIERLALAAGRPTVALTRRRDEFVPLRERMQRANDAKAIAFVSLHANSTPGKNGHGVEVYYLQTDANAAQSDAAARELAARENESARFEGPEGDLAYMLGDLVQSGKLPESRALATRVLDSIVHELRDGGWGDVRRLAVRSAPFYVLVGAHMPCALAEVGFIDHPVEGERLADRTYRSKIARGIFEAIVPLGSE